MIDPYRMVVVNTAASLILLILFFIYRFIYPKKKIPYSVIIFSLSLLPLISLLRKGSYESGDLSTHAMLSMSFFESLTNGDLIPVWGGEMNMSFGYPAFHFIYSLPYYIISLFHLIGFSFIASVKLLIAGSFISSGIFMYLFLKKEVKEIAAFTGALFYLFAPYHLIDLHFRVDVGEVLAFVFLPLCLLSSANFIKTRQTKWFTLEIISFSLLILSHPAISLMGFAALYLYILVLIKNKQIQIKTQLFIQSLAVSLSLLLTTFYWLPIMLELQFTAPHNFVHSVTFVKITELLYSPWRLGFLFQGPEGQLAFLIGYTQILVISLSILMLWKKKISKKQKPILLLSLAIIFTSIFMMQKVSEPLWTTFPFLKSFQFSYRFLGIIIFSTSIITAIIVNNLSKKWIIDLICFIAVFSTILNWGNRRNIPEINDEYLRTQIPYTATNGAGLGQATTVWSDPKKSFALEFPKNNLELIRGNGTIKEITRENNMHAYLVNAETDMQLQENTLYFPGWNLFINNKPAKIITAANNEPKGVMSFLLPAGLHKIEFIFQDTLAYKIGKTISIVTLISILIGILIL